MSSAELLLSNQLCFLVHRLGRLINTRYKPLLATLGLTYPQYLAMMALWEKRELGVGELCEMLVLDTGTVSPLLKRMESLGLVERRRRSDDERAVTVRLSPAGQALEDKARSVPGALASCLLRSEAEYGELKALFSGLIERLDESSCAQA